MKRNPLPGILLMAITVNLCAPGHGHAESASVRFDKATYLEEEASTSANASVGDLDGDGHLDIVLVKGRHWPVINRVLFGDGRGSFPRQMDLGDPPDRSYTGGLADLDMDGDLDIVISNDRPDANRIYLNNGGGKFEVSSAFGQPGWATRNIRLADLNNDSLPDIVVANRSGNRPSPNHVCLNLGAGQFGDDCIEFSRESATTISPADLDGDGLTDLVVPHRDGGQSHVYYARPGKPLLFEAHPFGPENASIRASAVADFNGDGQMDIVSIHTTNPNVGSTGRNSNTTVIYSGTGDRRFSNGTVISGYTQKPYALEVADLNLDGAMDILVGHVKAPTALYLNQEDSGKFTAINIGDSDGATYGFAIGDLNEDGQPDIVEARSGARNRVYFSR